MRSDVASLDIAATYNLIYNTAQLVEEGVGYALCLDNLVPTARESPLCFRPFYPNMTVRWNMIWKKYQVFSRLAEKFLKRVQAGGI
jgi:hypothetical protein